MFRVFRDCFHERTQVYRRERARLSSHRRRIGEVVIIDGGHGRAVVSAGIQLLSPPSSSPLLSLKRMARLVERR